MKYLKTFELLNSDWVNSDFYFLDDLNIVHDTIFMSGTVLRVEKKDKSAFLEIMKKNDKYNINVHSGSIEEPSKSLNARWWNLHNKDHDIKEVLLIMRSYGIISKDEYDVIINSNKYNL